jgi:hypothetical protein
MFDGTSGYSVTIRRRPRVAASQLKKTVEKNIQYIYDKHPTP